MTDYILARIKPPERPLPIAHDTERLGSTQRVHESSILKALRAATRIAHAGVEASLPMLRLMSDDYCSAEYTEHLCRLLGFYEPLEAALAPFDAAFSGTGISRRTGRIRHDLDSLGLTPLHVQTLPRCSALPLITDANVLGCLYVYEGVALGGQIIARRLRQSLGAGQAYMFYYEDAKLTAKQWNAFCLRLERSEAVSIDAVCAAAVSLFEAFAAWFEPRPALPATAVGHVGIL